MKIRPMTLPEFLCLLYAVVLQYNLIDSWISAPFERGSWIPLAIWLLPFPLFRLGIIGCCSQTYSHPMLLSLSLFLGLVGVIVSLNTLKNMAFVIVIGALVPFSPASIIWIISSIGWMRPLGYMGSYYFSEHIMLVRFLIVLPPTISFLYWLKNRGTIRETA